MPKRLALSMAGFRIGMILAVTRKPAALMRELTTRLHITLLSFKVVAIKIDGRKPSTDKSDTANPLDRSIFPSSIFKSQKMKCF